MVTHDTKEAYRKQNPATPVVELFASLNPQQYESAMAKNGVIRILAGPGTGKTHTLTTRIAGIIQDGVDPKSCLSITFTNKAAEQLKERIIKIAGYDGNFVSSVTFHGLARRFILNPNQHHEYIQDYGYKNGFVIIDPDDAKQLAKDAVQNLPKFIQFAFESLGLKEKELLEKISLIRTNGIDHKDHLGLIKNDTEAIEQWGQYKAEFEHNIEYTETYEIEAQKSMVKRFIDANAKVEDVLVNVFWKKYTSACIDVGGIDFDDMLVLATKLLVTDNNVAKKLAAKFPYISIDEFQDTNPVQYKMIKTIVDNMASPNLFTIGDPRQSIYKFRNAKVGIIMDLHKDYPACRTIEMSLNYRSTDNVLQSANLHAIGMNDQLTDGQLKSGHKKNAAGIQPVQLQFSNDIDEANWIAGTIKKLIKSNKVGEGQVSILYRKNSIRKKIEDIFNQENITFQVVGDISFYDKKEVKDVVNMFRSIIRKKDVIAYGRMVDASDIRLAGVRLKRDSKDFLTPLEYIESLGLKGTPASKQFTDYAKSVKGLQQIEDHSMTFENFIMLMEQGSTLEESKANILELFSDEEEMEEYLTKSHKDAINETFEPYKEKLMSFWTKYFEPGLLKYIKAQKKDEDSGLELAERKLNVDTVIQRLVNITAETGSFHEAIDEMVLMAENSHLMNKDAVQLMTIHAAKGLEFPVVILAGCEEETFFREDADFETIDEESRIFYVGKTRAEKMTMYTSCDTRFVNGEEKELSPLRFLKEDKDMSQVLDLRRGAIKRRAAERDDDKEQVTNQGNEVSLRRTFS